MRLINTVNDLVLELSKLPKDAKIHILIDDQIPVEIDKITLLRSKDIQEVYIEGVLPIGNFDVLRRI